PGTSRRRRPYLPADGARQPRRQSRGTSADDDAARRPVRAARAQVDPSWSGRGSVRAGRGRAVGPARCPPREESLSREVLTERPVLHALGEQESVRLADLPPGRDAEDGHDLLAVEVGADLVELLLLLQGSDARLEVVVGGCEARGLAAVARRAVRAGQAVQALEEGARVAHVAAHRGVGPSRVAVAVEAQVQLDEARDGLDGRRVETQG